MNKTDKNDARGIAEALRSGMYTRVHCKPEESINRAILLTARRALVEQQTHLKNTVRRLLKSYGIRVDVHHLLRRQVKNRRGVTFSYRSMNKIFSIVRHETNL